MKKILLIGNPNVGKSVVFSRLTGINVLSSNYAGTSIEYTKGILKTGINKYEVIDVPGIYSLEPTTKAEEVAVKMLDEGDIFINVLDSTNLERNLNLTLQIIKKRKPIMLILNFYDETKHTGISLDVKKLEDILGVPVIPVCAVTGEGINEVVEKLKEVRISNFNYMEGEKWNVIGEIVSNVQTVTHRHHTFLERLGDLTIKLHTGIPVAIVVLFLTFETVRLLAENIINFILEPAFRNFYLPFLEKIISGTSSNFIKEIFLGKTTEVMAGFGILTTGIYIPFVLVLPYIFSFYLVLSLLEDFGYLPRLAVLLDSTLHKFGLHGYSSIPIILGFGCKVPAILATRILETDREKIIATILILISAPCMPQTAMLLALGSKYGSSVTVGIFLTLVSIGIISSFILNKIIKGDVPELFVEIPPYRIPYISIIFKKLWIRLKGFLSEALPLIIAGVFIINIFDLTGINQFITKLFSNIFSRIFELPEEIGSIMILGFLRKDVSISLLSPFNLTTKQFFISGIFLTIYMPCIATFFTMTRELGIKTTIFIVGGTLLTSLILSFILSRII